MNKLLLIGAGATAKMVLEALDEMGEWGAKVALLDRSAEFDRLYTYPIVGRSDDLELFANDYSHAFVCIQDFKYKSYYLRRVKEAGFKTLNIVHPTAYVSKFATLGENIFISALSAIDFGSRIGDVCYFNIGTLIAHDNEIGNYVTTGPGATTAGHVKVGSNTFLGTNSSVIPHVRIGENVMVAAGATVISDVPDNVMTAGCPAIVKKQQYKR